MTLLPVDFEIDKLAERLDHEGFNAGARTVYVWEAVTQYLTEPAVRQTMDCLGGAATGSGLVFTFVRKDFWTGKRCTAPSPPTRTSWSKQGLWKFGLHPEQVDGFPRRILWRECEQVGPDEYADRYLEPAGQTLAVSEIERAVYAER